MGDATGKTSFTAGESIFNVDARYEYIQNIGHGSYGMVVSAKDQTSGQKVAIKKITNAFSDLLDAKRIVREIKVLSFLSHENIVKLIDVQRPPSRVDYNDIYLITELVDADLSRIIYSKQDLTDHHIKHFMFQVLKGLRYLHSVNVIHRDLKPPNLLVNKHCDLKICDFGLARGFDRETENMTEYVVTRYYRCLLYTSPSPRDS